MKPEEHLRHPCSVNFMTLMYRYKAFDDNIFHSILTFYSCTNLIIYLMYKLNNVGMDAFLKLAIVIASILYCIGSLRLSICNCGEDYSLE